MTQENLETVFDHINALRRGDLEDVASRLHPDIVHQGVLDDLVCHGRDEVLELIRRGRQNKAFGIDRIDFADAGEKVVLGMAGSRFSDLPWLGGQLFIVFTVQGGKIMRMDDYRTREEAFTAAGVAATDWQ